MKKSLNKKIKILQSLHNDFIKLSNDYNPIHISTEEAINAGFSGKVVHGIHLVLMGLNSVQNKLKNLSKIEVNFLKSILVGDEIIISNKKILNNLYINISRKEKTCVTIKLSYGYLCNEKKLYPKIVRKNIKFEPELHKSNELGYKGEIHLFINKKLLQKKWARIVNKIGYRKLHAIINLSTIIGMYFPGRNSIFKSCSINFYNDKKDVLEFKHLETDKRINLIKISAKGQGIKSVIEAFFRKEINSILSTKYKKKLSDVNKYKNQKALVIGASQGLGAKITQILAIGGGKVTATYNKNFKLIDKINLFLKENKKTIKIKHCDVLSKKSLLKVIKLENYNSIYLCATPKIFHENNEFYSKRILENFIVYYVDTLINVISFFSKKDYKKNIIIFSPSSTALNNFTLSTSEYSMSKYFMEIVAKKVNNKQKNIQVLTPRIDRLLTRQTISINPVKTLNSELVAIKVCDEISKHLKNTIKKKW